MLETFVKEKHSNLLGHSLAKKKLKYSELRSHDAKHNNIQHNNGDALGHHTECPFTVNVVVSSVIMLSHYTERGYGA
jgi:hypothetical protein